VSLTPGGELGYGLGLSGEEQGIMAMLYSLGSLVAGFIIGRAMSRRPAPSIAAVVFVILAGVFVLALLGDQNPVVFGLATLLMGIATGAVYSLAYNMVILVVEPERQASTSALVALSGNLISAILPVILFAIMNTASVMPEGVQAPVYLQEALMMGMLIPAVLALVGAGLAVVLRRKTRGGQGMVAGRHS
jgi:MFS family permease